MMILWYDKAFSRLAKTTTSFAWKKPHYIAISIIILLGVKGQAKGPVEKILLCMKNIVGTLDT